MKCYVYIYTIHTPNVYETFIIPKLKYYFKIQNLSDAMSGFELTGRRHSVYHSRSQCCQVSNVHFQKITFLL